MTVLIDPEQRWLAAAGGEPVSPVFGSWIELAQWLSRFGYASIEPMSAVGSKGVYLLHKQPFETWSDAQITAHELKNLL